ncbi:MAG: YdcF family protein [Pseudomonadales bacterium]
MISVFLDWFLQPFGLFSVAIITVWLLNRYTGLPSSFLTLCVSALLAGFLVLASPLFANFIVNKLELARENPCDCPEVNSDLLVVVLGGGMQEYVRSKNAYDILEAASIRRAAGAVDVASDNAQFVLLGGGKGELKESQLMASVLEDLGISPERITQERGSTSTAQNALELSRLFDTFGDLSPIDQQPRRIALVTSSMHIPRASRVFERQGFEVCHYATDSRTAFTTPLPIGLFPYLDAFNTSVAAMHEYLGYLYYWVRKDI